MHAYYSDTFRLPLPPDHRFPIAKYSMLRERVAALSVEHGIELRIPPAATDEELATAHTTSYVERVVAGSLTDREQRRIGFPWSPQLVERSRRSVGATLAAARSAFDGSVAVNLAGGTHHAFGERGQGFCVFNDVAVAIRVLQQAGVMRRAVVVDLDVHQGNGTASIFQGDASVFTFSIHGSRNFPFEKFDGDLDIALADGAGDEEYLDALQEALCTRVPLDSADCCFYLAGADPYLHDRLGRLRLTRSGLAQRDEAVMSACSSRGLPLAVTMAGGYARELRDIVEIHLQTVLRAADYASSGTARRRAAGRPAAGSERGAN